MKEYAHFKAPSKVFNNFFFLTQIVFATLYYNVYRVSGDPAQMFWVKSRDRVKFRQVEIFSVCLVPGRVHDPRPDPDPNKKTLPDQELISGPGLETRTRTRIKKPDPIPLVFGDFRIANFFFTFQCKIVPLLFTAKFSFTFQ